MLRSLEKCGMVCAVLETIRPILSLFVTVEGLRKLSGINVISTVGCIIDVGQKYDSERSRNLGALADLARAKNL
jgi:hypothetical protein